MLTKNGFLLVASKTKSYLYAAQMLADSLKEFAPEHSVVLFTEDRWVNDPGNWIFDYVYGDQVPSMRSKLKALPHTPFDLTCYLDVDMICVHQDAPLVFNQIEDDWDMAWTKIRTYAAAAIWWNGRNDFHPHGGMFLYRKNDRTISFMQQWWENWWSLNRSDGEGISWNEAFKVHQWDKFYPYVTKVACQGWDQFPLGLMLGVKSIKGDMWERKDIKWGYIKEKDSRWNWIEAYRYERENVKKDEIVFHDYGTLLFKPNLYPQLRPEK